MRRFTPIQCLLRRVSLDAPDQTDAGRRRAHDRLHDAGPRQTVQRDEVGPLPGAIVTISHEAGFVKTTAVQTDVRGEAVFPVLRAGRGYICYQKVADLRSRLFQSDN